MYHNLHTLPHRDTCKLEIVFMKHCAPSHMLVHKDDLTILYQLTKSEATSCNGFRDLSLFQVL